MCSTHASTAGQSRKSPSVARTAIAMAFSPYPRSSRSSLPGKIRCSMAPVLETMLEASMACSSSGFSGSPSRTRREQPHQSSGKFGVKALHEVGRRAEPVAGTHPASEHERVIAVDGRDLLRFNNVVAHTSLGQRLADGLSDTGGRPVFAGRRDEHLHELRSGRRR